MLNTSAVATYLQRANIGWVDVTPSAVTMSPYKYVHVYLTEQLNEGPHIIVSDAEEYGEEGILVGIFPHYEEPADETFTVQTIEEAVARAKKLATKEESG